MAKVKNDTLVSQEDHKKELPLNYQGSISGKAAVSAQPLPFLARNKSLAWDWIQYSAMTGVNAFQAAPVTFKCKEREVGTQGYKKCLDIFVLTSTGVSDQGDEWDRCAVIEVEPRVSYIDSQICLVKLDNKYCYQEGVHRFIELMNEELGIKFKNYTRIDCAIDFQSINYEKSPQEFLKECASMEIVMKGKKMRTYADTRNVNGITWGSRQSGASITMYNKTVEMRRPGCHKPWIAELWNKAGFVTGVNVYRLEFSLRKNLDDLIDIRTGESMGNHCDVHFIKDIEQYSQWCYDRHFQIAKKKLGEVKFDRYERLNILDMTRGFIKSERLSEKSKSTNYIKCQIKNTVQDAIVYQDNGEQLMSSVLFDYANQLVEKYYLNEWYNKKFAYLIVERQNTTLDTLIDEKAEHLKHLHKSVRQNFYRLNSN